MIDGVRTKMLRVIPDERGRVMEILRADDDLFLKFGQVYITTTYPQVVKAWHCHKVQTDHIVAVQGMIKLVLYDSREDSPTKGTVEEYFLGDNNRIMLSIPPNVLHGYKTIGVEPSLLINFPTEPYNRESPDEYRLEWNSEEVPYDWDIKMK